MENPIKMDDMGVPLFLETSIHTRKQTWKLKIPPAGKGASLQKHQSLWFHVWHVKQSIPYRHPNTCITPAEKVFLDPPKYT